MNKIFTKTSPEPLSVEKLAELAGVKKAEGSPVIERLTGGNICDCKGNGEFELMSKNPPGSTGPYMRCRKCGCISPVKKGEPV